MLYGPPASGKLTIAKELQSLSGYNLFHNHLLVDLLDAVDSKRSSDFYQTHDNIFNELISYAIKRKVNLINTFVFTSGIDDNFMDKTKDIIENNGGEITFIQITTDEKVLLERVSDDSRKMFNKISDPAKLKNLLEEYDLSTSYKHTAITINNTNLSPTEVAKQIWDYVSNSTKS